MLLEILHNTLICYENSSSGIDCIFLFKEGLSLDIKRNSLVNETH